MLVIRSPSAPAARFASRVVFGLAAILVAVLIRVPLDRVLEGRNVFIVLEPAIAVAAWYGGLVSGLTATAVAVVATVVLYLEPTGQPLPQGDAVALVLFAINGLILSGLSSRLRGAYERATGQKRRAEDLAARSDRLQRFSLALNRPMSPTVLAETAISQAVELLGATGGLVASGRLESPEFKVLATYGFTGGVDAGFQFANQPGNPLGEVVRTGEPAVMRGRGDRRARYPQIADRFAAEGDSIVLPLLYQGRAIGGIYLNFEGRMGDGLDDVEFLRSIGAQCGSALERATLIERTGAMAARVQARAAELHTVLQAIGDGLLVGGPDGQITLANAAAEQLLGPIPARLSDLPHRAGDAAGEPDSQRRYVARSPRRPDGWLEIAHFPVAASASETSSEVVLVRDVTRAIEAELQQDAFLGVLSHELRTPITTIVAGIELLRRPELQGDGRGRELLDDIDIEATRLHRIVEDLLVLTRSERGALDVRGEPVLVHRLVQEVVKREQLAAPDVEIRLSAGGDLGPVAAEPTYVQQIVRNLLSNALKYGRAPGQPIEIVVSQVGLYVETRVLDRGVGIGLGDPERLFTLFYRNPRVIASAPGAGIGLYVCRLLVEAMGGRTWAQPRSGGGAEFGFALPLIEEAPLLPGREDGRDVRAGSAS